MAGKNDAGKEEVKSYPFRLPNVSGDYEIQLSLTLPVTDAHMHIQSNDIAPIPIMLGMLNFMVSRKLHEIPLTDTSLKKKMNFANLSYIKEDNINKEDELKKVSRVEGGGPFVCDFANGKVEPSMENAVKELPEKLIASTEDAEAVVADVFLIKVLDSKPKSAVVNAIEKLLLNPLNENKRRALLTSLTASCLLKPFVKDYGGITRQNSFFVAGIYKNDPLKKSKIRTNRRALKFINYFRNNDKISAGERKRFVETREKKEQKDIFHAVSNHYYGRGDVKLTPSFTMSVIHTMELMYAHYWGAYGIPVYIPYEGSLYYITDNLINPKNKKEMWYNIYDTNNVDMDMFMNGTKETLNDCTILDNDELVNGTVKYTHFLKKAPASEQSEFEDLEAHLKYTKAAAVKYPLEFLPFYHVDLRRFYAPFEKISKYHNFFICDTGSIKVADSLKIQENIIGNDEEGFTNKMDFDAKVKANLIYKDSGGWTKGLFWGIKVYAALGYPPYLGVDGNDKAKKVFRCLGKDDYSGLFDMYKFCAEHEVPITCHGSPQGMTIADPGTYLKEYLKDNSGTSYGEIKNNFAVDGRSFMNGIGLIDSFSSPASWEIVLDALGENGKKLKLCLAHFGGQRYFNGKFPAKEDKDTPYRWLDQIAGLIKESNEVYTDISCFAYNSVVPMPESISRSLYNKVKKKVPDNFISIVYQYVDRPESYNREFLLMINGKTDVKKLALLRLHIILEDKGEELECYKELYTTANEIAAMIEKNEVLQHRILFGTDWPMSEMDTMGILKYSSAVFVLLQLVTALLGNKWDAWHQFAVINPLRFLGLLKDPGNDLDEYQIKTDKIGKMKEAIKEHLSEVEKSDIKKKEYGNNYEIKIDKLGERLNSQYEYIEGMAKGAIPSAKGMIDHDGSLILTGMKQGSKP